MAEGMSGRGAYWLGAMTGLVFSAAVAAALTVWSPPAGAPVGNEVAAARPEPEPAPAPDPAPSPAAPEPAASAEPPAPAAAPANETPPAPPAEADSAAAVAPAQPAPPAAPEQAGRDAAAAEPAPSASVLALADAEPPASAPAPEDAPPAAPAEDAAASAPVAPPAAAPEAAAAPEPEAAPASGTAPEPEPGAAPLDEAAPAAEPGPPGLALNRAPFAGPAEAPILAIVLSGVGEAGLAEVARLPFAVTILIEETGEAGARLAAAARAEGLETLGAGSPDAAAGPVIGVAIDAPPADRAAFFAALAARDLALLDLSAPGGSAEFRMARAEGLPAAPLGLRIDEIANSEIVYQSLERAALEARKRGVFVAAGEANPAVLAGLRRWMSVKAGKTIDLAPLSAAIDRTPAR